MRLLGELLLEEFEDVHPPASKVLERWVTVVRAAEWQSFVGVKQTFNTADYVAPYAVFDIGGNKFRIAAIIDFEESVVVVRAVMTHKEYNQWKP
jgi:mRNA interferase HigB